MSKEKTERKVIELNRLNIQREFEKILVELNSPETTVAEEFREWQRIYDGVSKTNKGSSFLKKADVTKFWKAEEYQPGRGSKVLLRAFLLDRNEYENALGDLLEAYNRDRADPNIGPKLARLIYYKSLCSFFPASIKEKFKSLIEIVVGAILRQT